MKTAVIKRATRGKIKGQFKFILKAANGDTIARYYPETYTQLHNCIKTLKNNFPDYQIVKEF